MTDNQIANLSAVIFLFSVVSLIPIMVLVGTAVLKPSYWLWLPVVIGVIFFPISIVYNDKVNAAEESYAELHKFDNDVVVIRGYDISNELQEYLNHGYELQGGSSIGQSKVCQTVIRKKK